MEPELIQCPQCQHWEGETAEVRNAGIAGCGLCDGTGQCETFRAKNGYDWEGPNDGRTNVEMCVAAIEEYGNCSVGQMAHMAPKRHAEIPFTAWHVEQACAAPSVKGIVGEAAR